MEKAVTMATTVLTATKAAAKTIVLSHGSEGKRIPEVYLSFMGHNVFNSFLSHLYCSLVEEEISTFLDNNGVKAGGLISSSSGTAIEDSRIAIVIISKNCASSHYYLDELAKIIARRKLEKLRVLPVFYRVHQSEVKERRGKIGKGLANYEAKLGKHSDECIRWSEALSDVASLKGWQMDADGDEATLVKRIVKEINGLLNHRHLYIAKHHVGIELEVEKIVTLLNLGSDNVLMVGLWGMGGVGKTTVAKAVYNDVAGQFDRCAFLANVRESATKYGLLNLQRSLLSGLLKQTDVKITSINEGISLLRNRLHDKKVLLLLDDVNDHRQLDTLIGGPDWFGSGSRILVTTRDSSVLKVYNEYKVHKVEKLADFQASQLFRQLTFPEKYIMNMPNDLVDRCLHYAEGLPLALVVLGSLLRGHPEHYWRSTMEFFSGILPKDIEATLKVSFDGLDDRSKEIFLAIACFFRGKARSQVEEILEACGFEASQEIHMLIDKSLIMVVGPQERIEMHNLVQMMARNIVMEVQPNRLRTNGRLSAYETVLNVLAKPEKSIGDVLAEVHSHSRIPGSYGGVLFNRIVDIASVDTDHMPEEVKKLRRSYDVFLSFRGIDSRHTIISHLYPALCKQGVRTFKDHEELVAGQRRSELFDAIRGSCIAVIVFSENYANSKWCLDELMHIIETKEMGDLTVVPIFYRVSPREVRLREKENGEKGCYQMAMQTMEANHGKNVADRWKEALMKGGDIIGFPLSQGVDVGSVVKRVVERVLTVLNRVAIEVAENPVGMTSQLEKVKPLLCIDPKVDDVRMLGIVGQGGMGKTTLSKAILTEHFRKFDDWCFLPSIREESKVHNGLALLQQKLLRKLLGKEDIIIDSVDEGNILIKERLRHKKVLIILDDIEEHDQLRALAGNVDWFGNQSRIIITTRNKQVLTLNQIQYVHELSLLNANEAEELFRWHAFHGNESMEIDQLLVDRFLTYAARLPLALVLLGKSLCGRSAVEWECTLRMLDHNPNKNINSVLKTSFDGLDKEERQMFLDISCFFKAWDKNYVVKVLESCGFVTVIGIKTLTERFLVIDDDDDDKFQMHDLIEVMGKSIVRDESSEDARSRIWLQQDFVDIFSREMVPNAVKGIVVSSSERRPHNETINGITFKGMYRLRILIVRNAYNIKGPLHLPRELRWFEWPGLSVSTIIFSNPSKLVALDLTDSNVKQIKGKAFTELKYLNLSKCESLIILPNLTECSDLEDLNLFGCKNLTKLDGRVGSLEKLVHLNIRDCHSLIEVPCSLGSSRLQTLNFSGCSKLVKLPVIEKQLLFLHELRIEKTSVKELPDSIGNLVVIKILNLSSCRELTEIPQSIYKLRSLEKLLASGCSKLKSFPRNDTEDATPVLPSLVVLDIRHCNLKDIEFLTDLTCFETLKELHLSGNDICRIPDCLSKFNNLEELSLRSCEHLVEVPKLPNNVKLFVTGCHRLISLPSDHVVIHRSPKRLDVDLSNCHSLNLQNTDSHLSLEVIRSFGGLVEAIVPRRAFPLWMTSHISECHLNYEVDLPVGISEDDILGLALSVTFIATTMEKDEFDGDFSHEVKFMIGKREDILLSDTTPWEDVHTWFVYLPRQSFTIDIDWSKITFGFETTGVMLESCGLHVVCKQEQDEGKFKVRKKEEQG